jgi:hypothetical protein
MTKTLLLISNRPEDKLFAEEVAQNSGLTLVVAESAAQGAKHIGEDDNIKIVFADTSTEKQYLELEEEIQNTVGIFSEKVNANGLHFISSENIEGIPYLIKSPLFGHFILRNYGDPKVAGKHYSHLVCSTLSDRAFGLEKLLKPGSKIQTIKFNSSAQKQAAVEAVKNYAIAAKFQNRMAALIANAVDEILMNAMFDAPVDQLGQQILGSTSRTTVIPLTGKAAVEMQVGFDGHHVAVSAIDLYGSLDKNKLLAHISKIYRNEEYKLRNTVAGAGLGLATVFQTGGSFFFVSEAGVRTEVTVFFKRTDAFREFKDQFRFLSTQFYFS